MRQGTFRSSGKRQKASLVSDSLHGLPDKAAFKLRGILWELFWGPVFLELMTDLNARSLTFSIITVWFSCLFWP